MAKGSEPEGEFEIIARYFAPLASSDAALGLMDDAAILRRDGSTLIVTTDVIVETVHFLSGDPPDAIAHKALAVNLSDLAAKAATPVGYVLTLCLPSEDGRPAIPPDWLQGFADGLRAMQQLAGIALIGGDTSAIPGPLTISITAFGQGTEGKTPLRRGAKPGDRLYVSGTIGDAALGLRLLRNPKLAATWQLDPMQVEALIRRYRYPEPRLQLASALREFASAAMDISDGLAGDIAKLCTASGVSAEVDATTVPLSEAAKKACKAEPDAFSQILSACDDYEILTAVPETSAVAFESAAARAIVPVRRIGTVTEAGGMVRFLGEGGKTLPVSQRGYTHFGGQNNK
ncbi:thiamine-phosphate kinase [Methyloligella sp. 2.7D]|uniref:thiamine-phosphate kinase n=1 Tax=unclassified Methyloligella TaxID=2625955 RepID=UPI00157BCBB4|nr:thiamine-phosphate kinase [Methyloligella sp. GL2]QKP77593.1 thiamine-phosphate kinase [Methyloligella sp. GL2]